MMYNEEQSIDIPRTLLGQHFFYYIDRYFGMGINSEKKNNDTLISVP